MNLNQIKIMILQALFLDDDLSDLMVLKGGTALYLYESIGRRSLDIDLSLFEISDHVTDEMLETKLSAALGGYLNEKGYEMFSFKFLKKPSRRINISLGYQVTCKFLPQELATKLKNTRNGNKAMHQKFEEMTGFKEVVIQISRNEYCETHTHTRTEEGVIIKIYTPEMILIEKLRALCQQMEEYPHRSKKAPRARDFFDIYLLDIRYHLKDKCSFESETFNVLVRDIFGIKRVDVNLLSLLPKYKAYHEANFPSVLDTVPDRKNLRDFNFYFDHVVTLSTVIMAGYFR